MQLITLPAPPPVSPIEMEIKFGTRETFDAMDSSQLMRQVKKHLEHKKTSDWWKQNPSYSRALNVCCEILKGRGIDVALDNS